MEFKSFNLDKEVPLRLARLREKKGVSARDMSLSVGQNASYINHIETGKALPSLTALAYICEYLEIPMKEFFDADSQNPPKIEAIVNDLKKLDDRQLDTVATLVKELAKKS